MTTDKIILNIKETIKNAHKFSIGLGKSSSINRDYLYDNLNEIPNIEIHCALIQMQEDGDIKYNSDSGLILILF